MLRCSLLRILQCVVCLCVVTQAARVSDLSRAQQKQVGKLLSVSVHDTKSNNSRAGKPSSTIEDGVVSFILSANTEMIPLSGSHLMTMMVDALRPRVNFQSLPNSETLDSLDSKENWVMIANALQELRVSVFVFACQECEDSLNPSELPIYRFAKPKRLGNYFTVKASHRFLTVTKAPSFESSHSIMYAGAMVRKDRAEQWEGRAAQTVALTSNKGAVLLYLTSPEISIAYAGTHLDAASPKKRLKNIKAIHRAISAERPTFNEVYIFGDLNYRLAAPLPPAPEDCQQCIEEPKCGKDGKQECKWCHTKYRVADGECVKKGTPCKQEREKIEKDDQGNGCRQASAADGYELYLRTMYEDHQSRGTKPNNVYEKVKKYDTLYHSQRDWQDLGYKIPDFTVNVLPTYKKYKAGQAGAGEYYKLQTYLEVGTELAPIAPNHTKVTTRLLKDLTKSAYTFEEKLKSCERVFRKDSDPKCVDFGWLDRLIYRGSARVLQYRTLKMHEQVTAGDHTPLFMLLEAPYPQT